VILSALISSLRAAAAAPAGTALNSSVAETVTQRSNPGFVTPIQVPQAVVHSGTARQDSTPLDSDDNADPNLPDEMDTSADSAADLLSAGARQRQTPDGTDAYFAAESVFVRNTSLTQPLSNGTTAAVHSQGDRLSLAVTALLLGLCSLREEGDPAERRRRLAR
jgi:hypothetical protein